MKISKLLMTGTAAMLLLGSCKKSGTDDAASASIMQFQLKATNPLVVVNLTSAPGTILWTSGTASSTEVKLEAKRNGNEIEYKTSGLQQIDLFASVIVGLGNISLPVATYSEVEFKITLNQNGSNAAMVLNGEYTNAVGAVTPVVFNLNSLLLLKAEQTNVSVTSNSSLTALTTLDLSFVSNGITQAMLNSATITGGKIIMSASSNINLYTIIINNLESFHHVDVTHH